MEKSYNYPHIWPFLLLVIYLLSAFTYCVASASNSSSIMCKNSEREALLEIKRIVGTFAGVESWVGEDCCAWQGVGCDNLTGYIIRFQAMGNLADVNSCSVYEGCLPVIPMDEPVTLNTIMPALLELKHLTHLELSGVVPQGTLSHLLGSMTHLRYLNLAHNAITGNVPPQLGNLTNLEFLDLSDNLLTIENLEWTSTLSNLRFIDISDAQVSQTVDLNQLLPVSHLSLSGCFYGNSYALSHSFVNNSAILSSLKFLDLSYNNLEGPVPPNLGNLSSLIFLDLSTNSFNGSFPVWLNKIKSLQVLNVASNSFSHFEGGIMGFMNNLCHLKHLDLSHNYFQSEILQPHVNISKCIGYELDFLDISNNQINGTLSLSVLVKLFKLSYLDMSNNQIASTLPSFIGQLKLLKHLDLSSNPIQGTILPIHIGDLSELSYLDVSYTNLAINLASNWPPTFQLKTFLARSCKIVNPPDWLHRQTSIEELDLSNTSMSGEPTNWISNMSNLHGLNLSHNFLTGPLPQQFSSQNLQFLDMHNNSLSGTLPNWLVYLESIDFIDLSSNSFSGSIPQFMGQNYALSCFLLNDNNLEGTIPPSLGNCRDLEILNLSNNTLSGDIPPWSYYDLPRLKILQLHRNRLGAVNPKGNNDALGNEGDGTFPESLCSLNNLEILDLQKNKLSGAIPDCWQNDSLVKMINLSSNKLFGVIPCSFRQLMDTLEYLHLNDNELHGEIPSCLSGVRGLKILDVGENNLSGSVPSWLKGEKFPILNVLRLSRNFFDGMIPDELCSLSLIRVLDLSGNQLTGSIPTCFGNLTGINKSQKDTTIDISTFYEPNDDTHEDEKIIELTRENGVNETIAGIVHEYSTILKFFTTIDLSHNHLDGIIPQELTKLSGLIVLNLSQNHLTGKIPEKIGDMKALETLDISRNNLRGSIPPSLGNIDFLSRIDFSFNNLSGPIPTIRHMDTLGDPSVVYAGNPYLCGDTLPKKCTNTVEPPPITPEVQENDEVEDKYEKLWFYLAVMLGFATGFWGIIGTMWRKKSWRHVVFRRVEDVYDWVYVGVTLKMSKLKKWMNKENSEE